MRVQRKSPEFEDEVETLMMLGNVNRHQAERNAMRGIMASYGLGR